MSGESMVSDSTPTVAMVRSLGLISMICGLIIVGAYQGTYEAVQNNKQIAVERAVFKVIPAAKSIVEYLVLPDGSLVKVGAGGTAAAGSIRFYAGYDASGKLAGIAAEGAAKGYADYVRILFSYDPERDHIAAFSVVASRETPGIGDKVAKDKDFLANFPLDAKLSADRATLAHEIMTLKHGTKSAAWQIDAIAGATITSRAVGKAINDASLALLPRLAAHLDELKDKP